MQITILRILLALFFLPTAFVFAAENPLSAHNKFAYGIVKAILVRSAEKMPEEKYSFKPATTVRSYGQIVGHVADSQYVFCSGVLGEKRPGEKIEGNKTSKADLIAALKESFAYCDRAYDSMTDSAGADLVKLMNRDTPKLSVLSFNLMHTMEHYGNLVTYMRMNDIVPPTSEPGFIPSAEKKQ